MVGVGGGRKFIRGRGIGSMYKGRRTQRGHGLGTILKGLVGATGTSQELWRNDDWGGWG